jgi:hypothetical protein
VGLTARDLKAIRAIVRDEVARAIHSGRASPIEGFGALEGEPQCCAALGW